MKRNARDSRGYNITPELTGKIFGRTFVVSMVLPKTRRIYWNCWCACGQSFKTQTSNLTSGHSRSCGCLRKELCRERKLGKILPDNIRRKRHARGMTFSEYNSLLQKQDGKCAICLHPPSTLDVRTGKIKSLSIDHDHSKQVNRGLLCTACNTALGLFKEDKKVLIRAIAYLQEHSNGSV